jgi:GNAT superfamily N-acetyltransferase
VDLGAVARQRVREGLLQERVLASDTVQVVQAGLREPWSLVVTQGKAPPYGYLDAGRVLILLPDAGLDSEPLAGLVWARERGKKFIHSVWVDPSAQRLGLGRVLLEAYRKHISPKVVLQGPFSPAGRSFAVGVGAKIVNDV